jgi:ribose transport system permease protein
MWTEVLPLAKGLPAAGEPGFGDGYMRKSQRTVLGLAGALAPSRELLVITLPTLAFVVLLTVANPNTLSPFNVNSVLATVTILICTGLSQLVLFAIGHFNLALTGMGAAAGIVLGFLLEKLGLPIPFAVAAALFMGASCGLLQGALIARTKLNPFIVTLGLASLYSGVIVFVTHGVSFDRLPSAYSDIGNAAIGPIPMILVISLGVCALLEILLKGTVYGRELLATGANLRVARSSGIATDRVVLLAHALSGLLAATAAVLAVARLGTAPIALGSDWLLPSFAVPVLGGTIIQGGKVSVAGAIVGATFLALVSNGLILMGVSQYWYQTGVGIIILAAVLSGRIRVPAVRLSRAIGGPA